MDTTSQATLKQALLRRDKQKNTSAAPAPESDATVAASYKTRDFLVVNFDAALAALLGIHPAILQNDIYFH